MNKLMRLLGIGLLALLAASPLACNTIERYVITSLPGVVSDDAEEAKQLALQVALPTVLVMAEGGTGSGVVLGDGTIVLTAAHVISHQDAEQDMDGNPTWGPHILEPWSVMKNDSPAPFLSGGTVLKIDYDLDLAVLKLAKVYPYATASLSKKDPYLYQKCWASGHPHGVTDPIVTEGRVQDLWEDGFIMYSAPTTFGNSGGPVFIKEGDRYLVVSVVQRVFTEGFGTAVNHMGLGCLPELVRGFLLELPH